MRYTQCDNAVSTGPGGRVGTARHGWWWGPRVEARALRQGHLSRVTADASAGVTQTEEGREGDQTEGLGAGTQPAGGRGLVRSW